MWFQQFFIFLFVIIHWANQVRIAYASKALCSHTQKNLIFNSLCAKIALISLNAKILYGLFSAKC